MAPPVTTTDVFSAIADPRRRRLIDLLFDGRQHAVNDVAAALQLAQPAVSKHLSVLRRVGIVKVTKQGQLRLYRLDPRQLKPIHDWVHRYERFWTHQISRLKERAERKALEQVNRENGLTKDKEK